MLPLYKKKAQGWGGAGVLPRSHQQGDAEAREVVFGIYRWGFLGRWGLELAFPEGRPAQKKAQGWKAARSYGLMAAVTNFTRIDRNKIINVLRIDPGPDAVSYYFLLFPGYLTTN